MRVMAVPWRDNAGLKSTVSSVLSWPLLPSAKPYYSGFNHHSPEVVKCFCLSLFRVGLLSLEAFSDCRPRLFSPLR